MLLTVFGLTAALASAQEIRYLSADGDDAADGKTPATAWRTVSRMNNGLPAGGEARLRCGDVFYGGFSLKAGLSADCPTVLTSYGMGAKPVISCTKNLKDDPSVWQPVSAGYGLWRTCLTNEANYTGLSSPNANPGFLVVDDKLKPWRKFSPYDVNRMWDFSGEGGFLYVYATNNPAQLAHDIRVAVNVHAVSFLSHTVISNLAVKGTGAHGMEGGWGGNIADIHISDCDFENIGGSELTGYSPTVRVRYGNGVEFGDGCDGATVERCTFRGIYDVAFTMQGRPKHGGWRDVHCRDCTMTDCTQAFEIWCQRAPKGVGFERCSFTGNRTFRVGGGWGALSRPNRQTATPLLVYAMETDTVDIDVSGNVFEDAPLGLLFKSGGREKMPAGYRIHDNVLRRVAGEDDSVETFRYESTHYAAELKLVGAQLLLSRLTLDGREVAGRLLMDGSFDAVSSQRPEDGVLVVRAMRGNGDAATLRFEPTRLTVRGAKLTGADGLFAALAVEPGVYDLTRTVDAALLAAEKGAGDGKFRVAGMPADGITWDLSYEGRDLGIYKSIELNEGVKLPDIVTDFSKVKYVRHELKLFPERANHCVDTGREIRKPRLVKGTAKPGFRGRVTAIERLTEDNVVGDESQKTWREKAWRGERVNCQAVVWTDKPVRELRLTASEFRRVGGGGALGDRAIPNGARSSNALPASAIRTRFVRYVVSNTNYKNTMGVRVRDDHLVGDILDDAHAYDLPANGYRPFWLTVDVPADARPGLYRGEVKVKVRGEGEGEGEGEGRMCSFVLELEVSPRVLPMPKDWKFFLDLWQTPWAIADFHQVPPFSDLHFELMKPHLKALADCGQKVITTTMSPVFTTTGWGVPRTMIVDRIWKDGRREFDFTNFDRYVELAKSCGIGPQIHVYSLVTFVNRPAYFYTDGETGAECVLKVRVGDPGYEAHMGPKLAAIEQHVMEKGWLENTYIALDELPNDITQEAIKVLRKYAPRLKTASAGQDVDVDVFSQGLQGDDGFGWGKHAVLPTNYLAKVAQRRAEGKITTYYICMFPEKPNAFMDSPLVESRWLGQYAAASGFDGLLRWSVHLWNRDPFYDSSLGSFRGGEPGDRHLMYPRALWSTRLETIRDGIEDFEKIRILRESGADMTAIDAALKHISTDDINADGEAETIRKVQSVVQAIEGGN